MKNFFLFLTFIYTCSINAQVYQGVVNERENPEHPIPYAKIYFPDLGSTILTDSIGRFEVSNIPEGNTRIEISAIGYETLIIDYLFNVGDTLIFSLNHSHRELDKVIVSNNGLLQRESITNIESHSISELNKIPSTSMGELISNIPGVYQSGVGNGISKPVIRGLSGSRVVTYLNGLRIENQQWGADHGLPITELGIGNIEVIKGPSSLLYGSDAIGGVLYFVDMPYASINSIEVFALNKFESNSLGNSSQFGFKQSFKSIRYNAYFGYDNHADYKLPNNKFAANTRYNQMSGKFSLGLNKKSWVMNLRYNYYQGNIGVPGESEDSIPNLDDFQINLQERNNILPRQFLENHFLLFDNKFFFKHHEIQLSLGNTNNKTQEFEDDVSVAALNMNLNTTLYNLKWKYLLNEKIYLISGSQGMIQYNRNASDAEEFLIPDANTQDLGFYSLLHVNYKKWHFQIGGRYDNRKINTFSADEFPAFTESYNGYNYSAGFSRITDRSTLRFNLSSGYRAPNTSELLSNGIHHGSFRYEMGNSDLKTEQAIQVDLSYGLHFEHLEVIINPFFNRMNNFIFLNQMDSTVENLPVFKYAQTQFAHLYGGDIGLHFHPHGAHWLHIETNLSTVFAEDEFKNPLPLIPQTRFNTQLRFEFKMKTKFQLSNLVVQHLYFFKQNRLGQLETLSSAYNLLHLALNMKWDLKTPVLISIGAKNLLNENYIGHLSGIKNINLSNPGINFYCSVKIELQQNLNRGIQKNK